MKHVLIVEDSATDRITIETYLEKSGLRVTSVSSAEDAIKFLENSQPNAIVLDVVMGGKSGLELCRQLKSNPITEKIPVVICSSKSAPADLMWGDVVGADAYVTKPINKPEQLTNAVWKVLNNS